MKAGRKLTKILFCTIVLLCLFTPVLLTAAPASGDVEGLSFLAFGTGKIQVRIYTDYFCAPCSSIEPVIEAKVADLVKRKVINVTFVDAPFHKNSMLYVRYYLYILNEKKDIGHILAARAALFEAAKANIVDKTKLEEFLQKKGIPFRPYDEQPTLAIMERYTQEDKVNATPMMVVYRGLKKEVYSGTAEIPLGLDSLK
jgi:hypothetical protein